MKKIFALLFIFTTLLFVQPVGAQSCDVIASQDDYNACCLDLRSTYTTACENFRLGQEQILNTRLNCQQIDTQADYNRCCNLGTISSNAQCDSFRTGSFQVTGSVGTGPFNNSAAKPTEFNPAGFTDAKVQSCSAIKFTSLINILIWGRCIITSLVIPLIFTLAFVFFMWNVATFIYTSDNKEKKEQAKNRILWGIVALFVMFGIWGIISIMSGTLGIDAGIPFLQTEYLKTSGTN